LGRKKTIEKFKERVHDENNEDTLNSELKEYIKKWRREGVLSFVEDAYFIRKSGKVIDVKPFEWQREVLEQVDVDGNGSIENPLIFLSTPVRQGKSLLARFLFAYSLICMKDFHGYFLSTSREVIQNAVFSELKEEILASPILSQIISGKSIRRRELYNNYNNSVARILPQKADSIVGFRSDIFSISELQSIENPSILASAYARVADSDGTLVVDSLMPAKSSPMRKLLDVEDEESILSIHQGRKSFFLNPAMTEDKFERAKTLSLRQDFEAQYLNKGMVSGTSRVFEPKSIESCIREYALPAHAETLEKVSEKKVESFIAGLGLDRSMGKSESDNTVLTTTLKIRCKDDSIRYLVANETSFPQSSGKRIKKAIEKEAKRLNTKLFVGLEDYQSMDIQESLSRKTYVSDSKLIKPDTNIQRSVFFLIKRLLAENRLIICDQLKGLLAELKYFGYTGTKFKGTRKKRSGNSKISDDRVYSLAYSIWMVYKQTQGFSKPIVPKEFAGTNRRLKQKPRFGSMSNITPGTPSSKLRKKRDYDFSSN